MEELRQYRGQIKSAAGSSQQQYSPAGMRFAHSNSEQHHFILVTPSPRLSSSHLAVHTPGQIFACSFLLALWVLLPCETTVSFKHLQAFSILQIHIVEQAGEISTSSLSWLMRQDPKAKDIILHA